MPLPSLRPRFRRRRTGPIRLGLQRRIMLYATVGLSAMFGVLAYLGLGAINQATDLVYQERLAAAHTTAHIVARDLTDLAIETREEADELVGNSLQRAAAGDAARRLLARFTAVDPSPFFRVSGVWLLDGGGSVVAAVGSPPAAASFDGPALVAEASAAAGSGSVVTRAMGPVAGETSFAAVVVPVGPTPAQPSAVIVVHTISTNSTAPYAPAAIGPPASPVPAAPDRDVATPEQYHLEVIDPSGMVILGIGNDERPGELSRHFHAITALMAARGAAAMLHEPGPGDAFEPHIMSVVPVADTPFYLVLEQPVDIALAIPNELRTRLLILIVVGFAATLAVAAITTRHVVRPTVQLTEAAQRMAGGDLASPVQVKAQDEVGRLADSLEVMRRRLQTAYTELDASNRELESRVQERTARLAVVLGKTISAQEDERHRLARELHDETAQSLAALSVALDRARDALSAGSPDAEHHVGQAKAVANRLLEETRRLILGLRPAVLDDLGLVPAVRWESERWLTDRGIAVSVQDGLGPERLPGHVEVALFRIVQEAVTNVARHSGARHAWIDLARNDGVVTVTVADDGQGFDAAAAIGPSGRADSVGLAGMQERVALLNGTMNVESTPGAGTRVEVRIRPGEITG